MWPDNETEKDFLNFSGVADTVAEIITQAAGRPTSIGISGSWGAGKSSMIKLVRAALAENHIAVSTGLQDYIQRNKVTDLKDVNFMELFQKFSAEEATPRSKAETIAYLKSQGEAFASFLEGLSDEFLAEPVAMPHGRGACDQDAFRDAPVAKGARDAPPRSTHAASAHDRTGAASYPTDARAHGAARAGGEDYVVDRSGPRLPVFSLWMWAKVPPYEAKRESRGYCQVNEKLVDRPPRYWARASREPAMLGIKNGRRPQLDNTRPLGVRFCSHPHDSGSYFVVAGRNPKSIPNMLYSSSDEIPMPWRGFDRVFVNLTVPA